MCNSVWAQDEKTNEAPVETKLVAEKTNKEPLEPINMNVFHFSPIHLLGSQFKIGYERLFNEKASSIMLLAGVILKENGNDTRNGASTELHLRLSVLHQRFPNSSISLFSGPFIKYKYIDKNKEELINWWDSETTMVNSTVKTATGGVMMGLRLVILDRISFNFHIGGGVKYSESSDGSEENSIFDAAYTGIVPEGGFLIGFKF